MVPSVPSVWDRLHGEYRAGKNRHDDPAKHGDDFLIQP